MATILVVDDSEAICKALRDVLSVSGYTVRTAPSGERALQILETTPVDLVITDLKMTGMSGLELLNKIKTDKPSVPVVMLTGFGDMDSVIQAMRSGVTDYLKKPFSIDEVLEVTARELRRSQQVHSPAPIMAPASADKPSRLLAFPGRELEKIDMVLSELRAETTAESVLLIEEAGYVISAKGRLNNADLPALSALVVAGRAATSQLASLLGESGSFALNYLEGQRVAVYTAGIGRGLFLVVIAAKSVKQGAVWVYAKKAATEIEKIVETVPPAPATAPAPAGASEHASEPAAAPLPAEASAQLDRLFNSETVSAGADLAGSVQTLTFEEAMARGLLRDYDLTTDN